MGRRRCQIAVVGGGLSGSATAIALALEGFDIAHVAPAETPADRRSTALIGGSVAFLRRLGVFEAVEGAAEPLRVMRIVDDTGGLLKAPTVEFRAGEIGLPAFGYNVLNADLAQALDARAAALGARLARVERTALGHEAEGERVVLDLGEGETLEADLVVGADGRGSLVRRAAGIAAREWRYPQTALVLNFAHRVPHDGVSTEFHTRAGPFTQVPLPGQRSSLVWVEEPRLADLVVDLKGERLDAMVEERLHSILGATTVDGPVGRFPLSGLSAERMTGRRVALVGEAAHGFPPIGAQGLNLGLRDAEALAKAAGEHRDDPGRASALGAYEAARRADVLSRSVGVDLLNRSLLGAMLPLQAGRSLGLGALRSVPALRRFAMREGVAPGAGLRGLSRSVREGIEGYGP